MYLSSFKWSELLLFINQILPVWYQNEEDIHLHPMILLLIGLMLNISEKVGLLELSRNFFAECISFFLSEQNNIYVKMEHCISGKNQLGSGNHTSGNSKQELC